MDYQSLSHSKWECKYHVVFIPKYRKKKLYESIRTDLGEELHRLAEQKESKILEGHMMSDHIHMLVKIPPKIAVSSFMGYLKGKSSLIIFENHANMKYKYGNRNFWSEGVKYIIKITKKWKVNFTN